MGYVDFHMLIYPFDKKITVYPSVYPCLVPKQLNLYNDKFCGFYQAYLPLKIKMYLVE